MNPIALAEAKEHLKVEHEDDDSVIATLLQASVDHFIGSRNLLGIDAATLTEIPPGIRASILLKLEILYDKNDTDNGVLTRAIKTLENPYRERWSI